MGKMGIILMLSAIFLVSNCAFGVRYNPFDPENRATVSFEVTSKNARKKEIEAHKKMARFCKRDSYVIERTWFESDQIYDEETGGYSANTNTVYKFFAFKCIRKGGLN